MLDGENYYFELGMEVASQTQGQEGVASWGYGRSSWNRKMDRTIGSPSCVPEGPSRPKARV